MITVIVGGDKRRRVDDVVGRSCRCGGHVGNFGSLKLKINWKKWNQSMKKSREEIRLIRVLDLFFNFILFYFGFGWFVCGSLEIQRKRREENNTNDESMSRNEKISLGLIRFCLVSFQMMFVR